MPLEFVVIQPDRQLWSTGRSGSYLNLHDHEYPVIAERVNSGIYQIAKTSKVLHLA